MQSSAAHRGEEWLIIQRVEFKKQDGGNKSGFEELVIYVHAFHADIWLTDHHLVSFRQAPGCNNFRISGSTVERRQGRSETEGLRNVHYQTPFASEPKMRRCSEEHLVMLSRANCWWDAYAVRLRPHVRRSHSLQKLGHVALWGSAPI